MNNSNFRIISILEGISFLLILGVTMPLKYYFENPAPNKFIGMAQGDFLVFYDIMGFSLQKQNNWNNKTLAIILACSIIPFGTFWMDRRYLKA